MLVTGLIFLTFYFQASGWVAWVGWPLLFFLSGLGLWVLFSSIWGLGIKDVLPSDEPSKMDHGLYGKLAVPLKGLLTLQVIKKARQTSAGTVTNNGA